MKLSDFVVEFFQKKDITHIFGYIGGAITHMVDSINSNENMQFIQTYHEQTAAIAAEGYSRGSKNIGVAIATSGPGATNLITGIADAYFDSIPVFYITGQVNTNEFKYDKPIRQQGFQEMDVISIVESITKYSKLIDDPEEILFELEKAYSIALSGRPGPVLLDIPMDIQRSEIDVDKLKRYKTEKIDNAVNKKLYDIQDIILNSQRPLILIGGGMINLDQEVMNQFHTFLFETQIPVLCSLKGKGLIHENMVNFVGLLGSYGNRCANMSIEHADLLIAIGSRLDTRQTGASYKHFLKKGKIIQIDIDGNELVHHRIKNKININLDVNVFIKQLISLESRFKMMKDWEEYIFDLKYNFNQNKEIEMYVDNKAPYKLIQKINDIAEADDVFVADIGQNQMWCAQTLKIFDNQKFYTSGGHAPMGFSLPFSVGLTFRNRKKRVFSISGDGGFHISTQSLMLISQYNLPIKIIVINNQSLGMITQFQSLYFNNKMAGTTKRGGYLVPDIEAIAKAYSLQYYKLKVDSLLDEILIEEIFGNDSPGIIEYVTDGLTTVSPKLEYNSPIYEPSPKVK